MKTRGQTMLATVLRGLRSRALLTTGSVLLTALAIGAAVLGPSFQVAVTNSYYVTRLEEAPNPLTGLTWIYQPEATYDGPAAAARDRAARIVDARETGPFAAAQPQLVTDRFEALNDGVQLRAREGEVQLMARTDACTHLEIEGSCPTGPDEVLMLVGDLDFTGLEIGDRVDLGPAGRKTVVGVYRLPESETDFWFDPQRLASVPRTFDDVTFERDAVRAGAHSSCRRRRSTTWPPSLWEVLVDRRLDVPPDTTRADLDEAMAAAERLKGPPGPVEGGTLVGDSINDLLAIAAETRKEQQIARASIAPAVFALVLVALALLLRLLMSAAELRLPELALASLRGLPRRRMWGLGLSEPVAVLALSVPVGVVIGVGLSLVLVRWWLVPGLPLPIPWESGVAALVVLVAAFGVSVLAVGLVLRSSLSEQLTGVRSPARHRPDRHDHPARAGGRRAVGAGGQAVGVATRPAGRHGPGPAGAAGRGRRARGHPGHGQAGRLVDQGPVQHPLVARIRRGPGHQPADGGNARHPAGHGRDRGLRLRRRRS